MTTSDSVCVRAQTLFRLQSLPYGVAVDHANRTFVLDTFKHQLIRLGTPTHPIDEYGRNTRDSIGTNSSANVRPSDSNNAFVIGSGAPGYRDGPPHLAQFNQPRDLAIDAHGVCYVADSGNHCIRRVDINGYVTYVVCMYSVTCVCLLA